MRYHRFIRNIDLSADKIELNDQELAHQLMRVFRYKQGDKFVLCNQEGKEALVEISEIDKKKVLIIVNERWENNSEPKNEVILYCAVLKRANFELICQKATEVGVSRIVPIITKRTEKQGLKQDRLESIIHEAAEQSGRAKVPKLELITDFVHAVKDSQQNDTNFVFDLSSDDQRIEKLAKVGLFIGPEGGWDDSELSDFRSAGFEFKSLGARTLRAETAAIISTYLSVL